MGSRHNKKIKKAYNFTGDTLNILTIIIIAISLSMDAFSLALIYGTSGILKKDKLLLSIIVGIYHFIMPLLGLTIGVLIMKMIPFSPKKIVGIIFCLIAIEMIVSGIKRKEEKYLLSIPAYFIFGLSVSLDSLTTGVGLSAITNKYILSCIIFAITSFSFTILGLNIGSILNIKYGTISTLIGGIILLIMGITFFS